MFLVSDFYGGWLNSVLEKLWHYAITLEYGKEKGAVSGEDRSQWEYANTHIP